jgi:hypothetical protein
VAKRYLATLVQDLPHFWATMMGALGAVDALAGYARALHSRHQLPAAPAGFVGRTRELAELRARRGLAMITGLKGTGGVGKTALSLVLAHEWAPGFPDAQLWLHGGGASGAPLRAEALLEQAIRAFHPTAQLPEDGAALGALYRQCLDGQRVLVCVDDAADAAQVQPLVPPAGCALIVSSRRAFTVAGVAPLRVDRLEPPEALALLRERYPALGDADGAELARLCAGLPLALRVAGKGKKPRCRSFPKESRGCWELADRKQR